MTAIRQRRTRSTVLSLVASVSALAAVAVLGIAGVRTLADSTVGRRAGGDSVAVASQRLPFTATALVGVADDTGRLTSAVVMSLEPDGTGGGIVGLAAAADAGSGATDELAPLASVLAVDGATAFLEAAERLTGLSFDVVEVVDQRRFAQLITPLGDLTADFPTDLFDASSGETWEAGETALTGPAAARAITASDSSIADWFMEPGRAAVWQAVADRVGAGIGTAEPVASDVDLPVPSTLDQFFDRLFAGPVSFRALSFVTIDEERIDEQLPSELAGAFGRDSVEAVVAHDRAELLMVLGAIAPSRLGAPLEAPSFRVVSAFADADLAELGLNRADVLKQAIDRLLFVKVNIVSVADLPDAEVPETTQIFVSDPEVIAGVEETYGDLFDGVEISVADVLIDGVDIEIRLGRSFLDGLRGDSGDDVAGSGS